MKKFYITTPLYYVNAAPHIGHAYTTLAADVLSRWRASRGEAVHFLTGTDEHGSKIEAVAKEAGKDPLAFADGVAAKFAALWKLLDVRCDDFIRTTEPRHEARVQAVFEHLLSKGDIFKGAYTGYYCVSCETYWTQTDLKSQDREKREGVSRDPGPICPDCKKPVSWVEEESYFFKLSRFQEPLLDHFRSHPGFLQPSHRAKEIVNFVKEGLRDLSVSRTNVKWGVRVPSHPEHTVYVWFDALLNYVTAAGYNPPGFRPPGPGGSGLADEASRGFADLWPADVHLVGKEIYRFHAVIWPAMLMALGLPLPKSVFAHGWWTVEGEKMSKSRGNMVDPEEICAEYGVDAFRYFLFREMPFGNDGDFSRESLRKRYNSELANDLGNLLNRVTQMVDKYLAGALPARPLVDRPLAKDVLAQAPKIEEAMERLAFQEALNLIWGEVGRLNRHVDKEAPWKLAKTDPEALKFLLFDLVWCLRMIAGWIYPFMPSTSAKMQAALGVRQFPAPLTPEEVLGGPSGEKIAKSPPLFPRKL
ncbi:MAG: methionine--tRNA ligase [Elusimicrobiota bacterium]